MKTHNKYSIKQQKKDFFLVNNSLTYECMFFNKYINNIINKKKEYILSLQINIIIWQEVYKKLHIQYYMTYFP